MPQSNTGVIEKKHFPRESPITDTYVRNEGNRSRKFALSWKKGMSMNQIVIPAYD